MPWETLGEIKRENAELERVASEQPPQACPIDGALLQVRGKVRNCPYGNYRWEG